MKLNIRPKLNKSEVVLCAQLMAASAPWNELYFSEEQCLKNLLSLSLDIEIAEIEDQFVGFLATRATGMEGEPLLEYICIKHDFRGRKIGTSMLKYVEEKKFPDADNIYLFVSDVNPRAITLYEKLGYEKVGELPNYNLWGQTEYLYRKFRRPRQERFIPEGTLTKDQNEGKISGVYDLNSGYAQIPLSKELRDCVFEGTESAIKGSIDYSISKSLLEDSLIKLLEIPPKLKSYIRATFSGSIALDRVFGAVRKYAQKKSRSKIGITAIIPEPSLDLWHLLLREQFSKEQYHDLRIKGVKEKIIDNKNRIDSLIRELKIQYNKTPERQLIVIIDSPSNPLGIVTSTEDLERLATSCGKFGAILIVDHCFLLAGLHAPKTIPSVFNLPSNVCDWVGIWDTGKSIDLAGDKFGVIVTGSEYLAKEIDDSLAVIQPGTYNATRSIEVFSRVLGSPHLLTYLNEVGNICRINLDYLQSNAPKNWTVNSPDAGTFACVYFEESKIGSENLRRAWLERGVHAAAGRSFFRSVASEGVPFLRISLVRDTVFFKTAIGQLLNS